MNYLKNLIENEPVLLTELVKAGIVLLVAFGLALSAGQIAAVMGFVSLLLTVIARAHVTPTKKVALTTAELESLRTEV